MTRNVLRSIARGLVGVLLFAQMAVASYACPGFSAVLAEGSQTAAARESQADASAAALTAALVAASDQTPDCAGMATTMDPTSPNLCAEHCRYGEQSDQTSTVSVPAAILYALYAAPMPLEVALPSRLATALMSALVAASPPHAILHCVYRI